MSNPSGPASQADSGRPWGIIKLLKPRRNESPEQEKRFL
jgi:hypothetical protein